MCAFLALSHTLSECVCVYLMDSGSRQRHRGVCAIKKREFIMPKRFIRQRRRRREVVIAIKRGVCARPRSVRIEGRKVIYNKKYI